MLFDIICTEIYQDKTLTNQARQVEDKVENEDIDDPKDREKKGIMALFSGKKKNVGEEEVINNNDLENNDYNFLDQKKNLRKKITKEGKIIKNVVKKPTKKPKIEEDNVESNEEKEEEDDESDDEKPRECLNF